MTPPRFDFDDIVQAISEKLGIALDEATQKALFKGLLSVAAKRLNLASIRHKEISNARGVQASNYEAILASLEQPANDSEVEDQPGTSEEQ